MEIDTDTATALLAALRLAREHGGAAAALKAAGMELPETGRLAGGPAELHAVLGESAGEGSAGEALALGFLAGRVTAQRSPRVGQDPTSFVMDRDLVCRAAHGESILRLPWFDDELFVGRQIPDISEMPAHVRRLCVDHYRAGLAGERSTFAFRSYGHAYSVDAVPVRGEDGRVEAVIGIATPGPSFAAAATAYERTAERLESSAELADLRADGHRRAGRDDAEAGARRTARRAREAADRARANARGLRARIRPGTTPGPPELTEREAEVLSLASHGLTYAEIGEQLCVSPATVRTHLEHVYPKLGASDKAAAVAAALRHGLIE